MPTFNFLATGRKHGAELDLRVELADGRMLARTVTWAKVNTPEKLAAWLLDQRPDGGAADANLVELNVWADSYASARSIAAACRTALQAATFAMTLETDSYEEGVYPELYQITQTWQVWTT